MNEIKVTEQAELINRNVLVSYANYMVPTVNDVHKQNN